MAVSFGLQHVRSGAVGRDHSIWPELVDAERATRPIKLGVVLAGRLVLLGLGMALLPILLPFMAGRRLFGHDRISPPFL